MIAPKIFISYSWKPVTNQVWVKELAERLSNDGIHVILDIWDLKEGQDKYSFMEQMVQNTEISKVLLICNKDYADRANMKKGGVGTESLIVSNEVYSQVNQEKFIPVVIEYDEKGNPYLPTFLSSRIYIDLSNEDNIEADYEKLIRNIFNKPSASRPAIGIPPSYVLLEEPVFLRTTHKIKPIKSALIEGKPNFQIFIDDYYNTFLESLNDFIIEDKNIEQNNDLDNFYFDEIEKLRLLKDDYIIFLDTVLKYSTSINIEKLHSFLEMLIQFNINYDKKIKNKKINTQLNGNHIYFISEEIFIHTLALILKHEEFEYFGHIVNNPFFIYQNGASKLEAVNFLEFNEPIFMFEHRNKRLKLNRVNLFADTIKQRSTNDLIKFEDLQEVDVLLYYISCLQRLDKVQTNKSWYPYWFPNLSCYHLYQYSSIDKIISQRYFDKFKIIFQINSKEELIEKIKLLDSENIASIERFHYRFPDIKQIFSLEKIGTYK